jgi:WD40 repeat protein
MRQLRLLFLATTLLTIVLTSLAQDKQVDARQQHEASSHSGAPPGAVDLRGFTGIAFSPNGRILAAGSFDHTIKLWDPQSWALVGTLEGHSAPVTRVAFSHDGEILASGSGRGDLSIKLWNVSTHKLIRTLVGHEHIVNALAFSPDDGVLVSGSEDHTVRFWEVRTGNQLRVLRGKETIWALSFDSSGKVLAVGNHDGYVEIYDGQSGRFVRRIDAVGTILRLTNGKTKDPVMALAFRPGKEQIVTGSAFGVLLLWDTPSGESLTLCWEKSDGFLSVAFSPDGSLVAAGASSTPG